MRSPARFLLLAMTVALVATGCNRDSAEETTTTLGEVTTTAIDAATSTTTTRATTPPSTTTTTEAATTSTTRSAIPEPEWTIAQRIDGDDGATVVVLLDPESYERLTDIDVQNIVEDAIDMFPPIYEVHVVDSQDAADIVLSDVIDTDDQPTLDDHYFARLEEGFRLVFLGPFSDIGITILGS